jgi:hypothetical protein
LTGAGAGCTIRSLATVMNAHPRTRGARLLQALVLGCAMLCGPARAIEFGVNLHHGSTPEVNSERAALMKLRHFTRARMDYVTWQDTSALRDQIRRIRADGGSVELVLWTPFGNDHSCSTDLPRVEASAYDDALHAVRAMQDLVHDFELLNETQQRPEIRAETDYNHIGASPAPYRGKRCMASLAAGLRGMSRAIRDARAASGLPLRAILGLSGRDFGFLTFMQESGVLFDAIGVHLYPEFRNASLLDDPWWGDGGPFAQLARFGKPVDVNEMNCGEIYRPTYENEPGRPLSEQCLKSLARHVADTLRQTSVRIEAITFYELVDEPRKRGAEGMFGLLYDLQHPKPNLYLCTAFAGGTLAPQERAEITRRGLMTDAEIDARRALAASQR